MKLATTDDPHQNTVRALEPPQDNFMKACQGLNPDLREIAEIVWKTGQEKGAHNRHALFAQVAEILQQRHPAKEWNAEKVRQRCWYIAQKLREAGIPLSVYIVWLLMFSPESIASPQLRFAPVMGALAIEEFFSKALAALKPVARIAFNDYLCKFWLEQASATGKEGMTAAVLCVNAQKFLNKDDLEREGGAARYAAGWLLEAFKQRLTSENDLAYDHLLEAWRVLRPDDNRPDRDNFLSALDSKWRKIQAAMSSALGELGFHAQAQIIGTLTPRTASTERGKNPNGGPRKLDQRLS